MTEPTRLLAVDCGNTQIKFGVFRGDALSVNFRIATDPQKTSDEYAVLIRALLAGEEIDSRSFDGAALSSVVPPVLPLLERAVAKVIARPCLVIRPGLAGVAVKTANPGELEFRPAAWRRGRPPAIRCRLIVRIVWHRHGVRRRVGGAQIVGGHRAGDPVGGAVAVGQRGQAAPDRPGPGRSRRWAAFPRRHARRHGVRLRQAGGPRLREMGRAMGALHRGGHRRSAQHHRPGGHHRHPLRRVSFPARSARRLGTEPRPGRGPITSETPAPE